MGQDWRSPGEEWVKTDEGWEKKKILAVKKRLSEMSDLSNGGLLNAGDLTVGNDDGGGDTDDSVFQDQYDAIANAVDDPEQRECWQPYCPITLKCTREIAGFNGLGEAFKRLDFPNAVRDIRRFHYVCKLLHLIITQNLTTLSGCAQKVLFSMLEGVASEVSSNQTNIHILRKLLNDLHKTLLTYYCWGRPLGSTILWEEHKRKINRIHSIASCIQIKQPDDTIYPKLQNLPEECIREILLRLSDHKDLQNGGEAYSVMQCILGEQHIWRELCKFHFSRQQIQNVKDLMREEGQQTFDWQQVFHRLRRLFGLKEEYAEILQLCRHCRCLFWKSIGHPCRLISDERELDEEVDKSTLYVPIPPQAFLKFFSL